ncbi:MAG: pyridoxamine 5'-phosphate oxidase [Vicinamibacteria bacterium]|jgi:pyridoxamine 5'-phosphate oxidase|nr:pyridoxamine 5'-phosphate oxidase [Vicinamibacteria bacterium]
MPDPIRKFHELYARARKEETIDATAVALATADASGRPSVRMVLLKAVDTRGFVFYTNHTSRKAAELGQNPRAALCFHWPKLAIQVRIEGAVERVSETESDAYFAERPRISQLGAWASKQSRPLLSRAWLLLRLLRFSARHIGRPVPRPPFWGGYRVVPQTIEFWYNQNYRLHDRNLYTRQDDDWRVTRLYP